MSPAEVLFNLFTVLLGLTLVEVFSGFSRALRAKLPGRPGDKPTLRLGWMTPLLATYAMLSILLFWISLWGYAGLLPLGYDTATAGLILLGLFYFAASMIFPENPRDWPSLDDWFWLHRRQVILSLLFANLPFLVAPFFLETSSRNELVVTSIVATLLTIFLLTAAFARNARAVVLALALLVAVHLAFVPLDFLHTRGVW